MNAFSELPKRAQDALAKPSTSIDGIIPLDTKSWTFAVGHLPKNRACVRALSEIREWAGGSNKCLYFIKSKSDAELADLKRRFLEARSQQYPGRAYSRLNDHSKNMPAEKTLYLGISGALAGCIAQHLGYGPRGTYALQLRYWAGSPLNL